MEGRKVGHFIIIIFENTSNVVDKKNFSDLRVSAIEAKWVICFHRRYGQIHNGSDNHLKWRSCVIGFYP